MNVRFSRGAAVGFDARAPRVGVLLTEPLRRHASSRRRAEGRLGGLHVPDRPVLASVLDQLPILESRENDAAAPPRDVGGLTNFARDEALSAFAERKVWTRSALVGTSAPSAS